MLLRLASVAFLLLGLAAGQARAGQLTLNYFGETADGSSLGGAALDPGTDFEIHVVFDSVPFGVSQGVGNYQPTEITAMVGGASYSGIDASLYFIQLGDPSRGGSTYYSSITNAFSEAYFVPIYGSATPELDATAASPTVFSDYQGSGPNILPLSTSSGLLVLTYDVGVSSSITGAAAVPEPSSVVMLGSGVLGLLGYGRRRRARARA